jgi:putative MATE family efflux protein
VFDKKATFRLFWPVFVEQTFAVMIGFLATIMVRSVSEDAMAGVGLVGILNFLVMNAFTAVAAGVSVVVSQCVGRGDYSGAGRAGTQSVVLTLYLSVGIGGVMALLSRPMLGLLFGGSEPAVLEAAHIFFVWSCLSTPFLALFSTLSGIVRSTGNVKPPMFCSVLSNIVYVLVAALCIQTLQMGVAGAGVAITVSRLVPALLMSLLMLRGRGGIFLSRLSLRLSAKVLRPVLRIAVPSGVDSLIFNGGKLVVNIFMSGMGTPVIAANAIVNNLASVLNLPGTTIQTIGVTIVGQAYGKGDIREARRQSTRLTLYGMAASVLLSLPMLLVLGPSIRLFDPSPEAFAASRYVMFLILAATPLIWPASFIAPQALRACNDVVYTMWISIISMLAVRVFGSWLLGVYFEMNLFGIWLAMVLDWVLRGALFMPRLRKIGALGRVKGKDT